MKNERVPSYFRSDMSYLKVRCAKCNRVILEEDLSSAAGTIKKKCERCGEMNYIPFERVDQPKTPWYSRIRTK